jgi:hypothetical protein
LGGRTAWLLKKRHRECVEHEVELRHPDGRLEIRRLTVRIDDSATDADVVRQIGESLGINPQAVSALSKVRPQGKGARRQELDGPRHQRDASGIGRSPARSR